MTVAALLGAALVGWVWTRHGAQRGIFALLGTGLGAALFHSRFGFTSAWRHARRLFGLNVPAPRHSAC